jgi:hypothetical protein
MAIIYSYQTNTNILATDLIIGSSTKVVNGKKKNVTKNFGIGNIAEFYNEISAIAIAGQNNFFFQNRIAPGRKPGTISFINGGGTGTPFSNITTLRISKSATSGNVIIDYINTLVNQAVIIAQCDNLNNFGIYKFISISPVAGNPDFFDIVIESVGANSSIQEDKFYTFAVYPGFVNPDIDPDYIFTSPLVDTAGVISIGQSSSTSDGYLSSVDWNVFNDKQNSLGFTPENVANKSVNLTSPDNTKYPTTQAVVDGLATKQNTLTNPVTGTGANGQVAFWNGTNSQTGDNGLFWDNTNKRLGVGTSSPSDILGVNGPIRFSSITNTSVNGFSRIYTLFALAKGETYIAPEGSTNPTRFFPNGGVVVGPTAVLPPTNGLIVSGNVGIGTTTVGERLVVSGNAAVSGRMHVGGTTAFGSPIVLGVSGQSYLNGNVGIATTSPQARLDVRAQGALSTDIAFRVRNSADTANIIEVAGNGSILLNGSQTLQGTVASDTAPLGTELLTTGTGDASWTGTSFATGYTHIIGSVTTLTSTLAAVIGTFYQITYTVTGRTAGSFTIAFGGSSTGGITATGNTGPSATTTGTLVITPTTDFNGTIVLSIRTIGTSSANTIFRSSTGLVTNEIRVSGINSNTFIGLSAGRRNTTGTGNSFYGLNSGTVNTTGSSNVGVGSSSLLNNNIGSNNSALGVSSLEVNTTGSSNVSIGAFSLQFNTTGTTNTAIGLFAGRSNTVGSRNLFAGDNSGRFIADGTTANTISGNSIFLGSNTRALADNQTNQIVIGNDAIGLGTNSVVLGNASIVSTMLRGNVGIGLTTAASARLQVNGGDIIVNNGGTGVLRGDNPNLGTGGALRVSSSNTASSQFIQLGQALSGTGAFTPYMTVLSSSIVGIGTVSPVNSAQLQIDSTTRGFLPPRMTNAQRLAIATPAIGLMVYCTDTTEGLYINKSTGWTFVI